MMETMVLLTMKWMLIPAVMVAFVAAAPAYAETREEAVAYTFLGLADDAKLTRGTTNLAWQEVSSSPAVFTGHGAGKAGAYDVTFTVTALSNCDYEVQLAGPPGMVRGGKTLYARIALGEITAIKPGALTVDIEGAGFCATGQQNPACVTVHKTDLFGTVEPDKHARLVTQLHNEVCVKTN